MESKDFIRINPDQYNADVSPVELGPEFVNYLVNMRPDARKLSQIGGDTGFLNYPINHHPIGGGGSVPISELPEIPFRIKNITADNDYTWLIAGSVQINALINNVDLYNISPAGIATGAYGDKWIIENFNSVPVFNRGIEVPYYWDLNTANRCLPLPGWPVGTVCRSIRAFKNHLIGLNVSDGSGEFPDQIIWSNAADAGSVPPDWDFSDTTSLAGALEVSDTRGALVDSALFRNSLLIYKTQSVYRMDYIGPPFVFSVSLLFDSFGAVAPNCIVEIFGGHVVLTNEDLIFHDGHQPRSLLKGRIKERFAELINSDLVDRYKSFLFHYFDQNEIWIFFLSGDITYPNLALIYNYVYDNFSFVSQPQGIPYQAYGLIQTEADISDWDSDNESWDLDTTLWRSATSAGEKFHVIKALDTKDIVITDNAVTPLVGTATVARYVIAVPPERAIKFLYRVNVAIKPSDIGSQFELAIGTQMEPEDPISWSNPYSFTALDETIDLLHKGRYFSYSINGINVSRWELRSIGFTFKQSGEF